MIDFLGYLMSCNDTAIKYTGFFVDRLHFQLSHELEGAELFDCISTLFYNVYETCFKP